MKSKSKGWLGGLGCLLFSFALMFAAMLAGNLMTVYAAEGDHVHCVCGGGVALGDHTTHSDITFSPYSGGDVTYDETGTAYLYLVSDVVHSSKSNNRVDSDGIFVIKNGQTLYLCLNGYSLQNDNRTNNVIDITPGGKLILCDCKETGWIGGRTSGSNSGAVWVDSGTFTMYGGNLKNNSGLKYGGGLYLKGSGSAMMYGGTIADNFAFSDGGGVFLDGTSSFTMYGGSISGNKATDDGGGVFVKTGTTLTMYGGVIEKNETGSNGGGVFVTGIGKFIINDGSIKGNTAAGRGGGICAENGGEITLNDGVIENNVAHGNGGGISSCWSAKFTMNGGVVKNNESKFNGGGIFLFGNGGWSDATSTFIITGGTVEKNKAGGVGGGIYFYEYTNFTMNATTADIIITDNEGSNLYLTDNKKYVINLTALTEGSRIGVTAMRNPWIISTANDTDYSHLFSADSDKYHVGYNPADKKLALTSDFTKFTVRYDLNGGDGTVADSICKTFTSDGSVQVTSALPTRKYHVFLGWAETSEATSAPYTAGDTLNLTGDKTLYAVWSLSHDLTKVDRIEPDCTHDGKEEYWSCACGKFFEDAEATVEITDISTWGILPAYHNTLTKVDGDEPDCIHDGKEEYWSCSICGKYYADEAATVEIADIDAWGNLLSHHALTKVNKVAPDCTHNGKEAYWSCSVCNKYFEDPTATVEIADIDTWSNLPVQHTFTDLIAEVAATCESEGVKAHKDCEICHKHFDANGNEMTDLTIEKLTTGREEPGEKPENGEFSGGAIVGITIGSVAVAEIGGFSIFWFAIKKKKFADLIAAIKKK